MGNEEEYTFYISIKFWESLKSANNNTKILYDNLRVFDRKELIEFQYNLSCASLNLRPARDFSVQWGSDKEYYPDYEHIGDVTDWVVSMGQAFYDKVLSDFNLFETICRAFLGVSDEGESDKVCWESYLNVREKFNLLDWDESKLDANFLSPYVNGLAREVFDEKYVDGEELWEIVDEMMEENAIGLGSDEKKYIKYINSY